MVGDEEQREARAAAAAGDAGTGEEGMGGMGRRLKKHGVDRGSAVGQKLGDQQNVLGLWTWAGPMAWEAVRAGDHVQMAVEGDSWR